VTLAWPGPTLPTPNERELLLAFLRAQRGDVVRAADGLTEAELRWTPDGRLLPIIGVINHLTHTEWRWIDGRYLGSPFPPRDEELVVGADVTGEEVIAAYDTRARRTDEVVRAAPSLEVPCLGAEGDGPPAHVLIGLPEPIDLRWTILHLIEETAHHAGHVDSTREMLDGMKAGELLRRVRERAPDQNRL
jgi:Protein of unknown function (DUF664)